MERLFKSINHLQKRQTDWYKNVKLPPNLEDHRKTLEGEMEELKEIDNLHDPKNKIEVISELCDIGLISLGMLGILGVDAFKAYEAKLDRNYDKYHPGRVLLCRKNGMSQKDAMKHCKTIWDRSRDEHYLKRAL